MSNFVVACEAQDVNVRNSLTNRIRSTPGVGWWHYFPQFWIIIDPVHRNAVWWRDWLHTVAPAATFLVFEAGPDWAGYISNEQAEWINQNMPVPWREGIEY
jgi:hypothetical protein